MKNVLLLPIAFLLFTFSTYSQDITETNSDIVYQKALEAYQNSDFETSLKFTRRGLELAPEYHDIRILQIRNYWALENYIAADEELFYLLKTEPGYVDVKPLVYQRLNRFSNEKTALDFIEKLEPVYPGDMGLQVNKARLLLNTGQRKEARSLALDLVSLAGISGEDRYILQTILNRSVTSEMGVNYQYIGFSEDYSRQDPWHNVSGEYQHNFNRTAVIGRVNYSNRGFIDGTLYELEAYPVFSDRFYAFTNIGVSNGNLFPDLRSSLSLFYNFAKVFEAEAGARMLYFNNNTYYTGIVGLTLYQGKFYFNIRTFVGPERGGQMDQNYQGNIRYYFKNVDNYLFVRLGSGISPDERVLSTQVIDNPGLEAYYGNVGINFSLGVHHILNLGAGALYEDITPSRQGTQVIGFAGYRYRF